MKKIITSMDSTSRSDFITYGMVIAAFIIISILQSADMISSQLGGLLVPLCVYSIMAVSLNLVVGTLGELSIGHAGFMCLGAFASAFFTKCVGEGMPELPRFIIAIIIGGIVAGIFGFLIGIPVFRLNGDYLAIVTLAFGEIIKNIVNALYIGRDANGFHFSLSSANNLDLTRRQVRSSLTGRRALRGRPERPPSRSELCCCSSPSL